MAWSPSKEVVVARDAAESLDAPMCVILWVTRDGKTIGTTSYGETKALCDAAGRLGKVVNEAAMKW